jgi:hypothetical protein
MNINFLGMKQDLRSDIVKELIKLCVHVCVSMLGRELGQGAVEEECYLAIVFLGK